MRVIGVVGGMGSGKSTVVQIISELTKAYIINVDHIGHTILKKDYKGYLPVVKYFGTEIIGEDEEINRSILGDIVFSNRLKLQILNEITHPLIYEYIKQEINIILQQGVDEYIIIDAALLIEIGLTSLVDEVWGVYAPLETRIQRVMLRNGFSRQEAITRISSQLTWDEMKKHIDRKIDNSKEVSNTKEQILSILK